MKKLRTFILTTLSIFWGLVYLNCSQDISSPDQLDDQRLIEFLRESFDGEIKDMGSYFTVAGDLAFRKDQLSDIARESGTLSKTTAIWCNLKWSPSEALNITYNIEDLSSQHRGEFETAVAQWNDSGACVDLQRTTAGNATIVAIVDPAGISGTICGETVFPTIVPPTGWDEYNMRFRFAGNSGAQTRNQRLRIMMHEIGHRLGLAHSDPQSPGADPKPCNFVGAGAEQEIPGTQPNGDATSVMRTGQGGGCGTARTTISQDDKLGLLWLYPLPNPPAAPFLQATTQAGHPKLTWQPVTGADHYKITKIKDSGTTTTTTPLTTYIDWSESATPGVLGDILYKVQSVNKGGKSNPRLKFYNSNGGRF